MAERTPSPVTTGSGSIEFLKIEFLKKELGELANVFRCVELDARDRQAEGFLHHHGDLGTIDGIGAEVHQAISGDERMRVQAGQDLPRLPRNELQNVRLAHDRVLGVHATVTVVSPCSRRRRSSTIFPSNSDTCRSACSAQSGSCVTITIVLPC